MPVSFSEIPLLCSLGITDTATKLKLPHGMEKKKDAKRQERAWLPHCVHKLVEVVSVAASVADCTGCFRRLHVKSGARLYLFFDPA